MQFYNTLSRQKETFKPLRPGKVGFYACGVTVYDDCHLGHARSCVAFEVLVRHLQRRGLQVTWVRNFTDIDDKIIRRAQEVGVPWKEIAERYIASFQEDMTALGLPPAQIEPKATEHIPEIIDIIRRLEDRGFAYAGGGDVFFRVRRFPGYGKLSGQKIEDMEAGARIEVDPHKEDPLDFVLWKGSKPGEPAWDSPWGPGRPGWHIECSAMSMRYLGDTFDLHGGGQDLVFPHHENELAQSEAATGKPFARFWLHHGLLTINQEKMSKSLGNFFTVKEVLQRFPAEVVRFFLINCHTAVPWISPTRPWTRPKPPCCACMPAWPASRRSCGLIRILNPNTRWTPIPTILPWRNSTVSGLCGPGSTRPWTTISTPPRPWATCSRPCAFSTASWRRPPATRAILPSSGKCMTNWWTWGGC